MLMCFSGTEFSWEEKTTRAQGVEMLRKKISSVTIEYIIHHYIATITPLTDYVGFSQSLFKRIKLVYKK